MADEPTPCVKREDFAALCEQVLLIASELERADRAKDPEGPNGWELRETTVIKEKVLEILGRQNLTPAEQAPSRKGRA